MFPSQFQPYPEGLEIVEVIPPTAAADAGATASDWIDIGEYEGNLALCLQAALASDGTAPTLTISIEHRVNSADTPAALPAGALQDGEGNNDTFDVVTDAANAGLQKRALIRSSARAQIKVTATVGGADTPAFEFAMFLVGSKKYGAF